MIQGDVDLVVPVGGVEVSNSGGGTVTVNDEPVKGNDTVVTEKPGRQIRRRRRTRLSREALILREAQRLMTNPPLRETTRI